MRKLPAQFSVRGFTLIELLVAITIVAIMATVGIIVFGNLQQRTRNVKRSQDLGAIAGVLEGKKPLGRIFYKGLIGSDFAGGSVPEDPRRDTQKYCFWGKTNIPPDVPPTVTKDDVNDFNDCTGTAGFANGLVVAEGIPDDTLKITSWTICAQKEGGDDMIECRSSRL